MTHSAKKNPTTPNGPTEVTSDFFCVGNNHRTADIATREAFVLSPEQVEQSLIATSKKFELSDLAIISTCNRCEVFGFRSGSKTISVDFLHEVYTFIHESVKKPLKMTHESLTNTLYTFTGIDAVRHTFHVASSLDSLVPGETQITGQFKDAIAQARNAGTLGTMLGRLAQEALGTAKKIRSETDIGRHKVSISHAAIDLARRASPDLSKLSFLILGAGEMSRVAAEYAASYKPQRLMIANRNHQKAVVLSEHLNYGEAHGLDQLVSLIAKSDVVISATSAPGFLLTKEHIRKAMQSRQPGRNGPIFLIDIALPRDIDPRSSDLDDVYLFDIDDLKSVVESHMDKRREAVLEATSIVSERVANFAQWLTHQKIAPTLSASSKYFADTMLKEAQKTLAKEHFSSLSAEQRASLDAMFAAIASRFAGDIARTMRKASEAEAQSMTSALFALFDKESTP